MSLLTKTVAQTGKKHSATVFFLHGSGDTGPNLVEWVRFLLGKDMQFGHVKMVFPTAPLQPYTPLGGEPSNVWFDRLAIEPSAKEDRASLDSIYERVAQLIDQEVQQGIPLQRIIVGGFSMGGALAFHVAYHLRPEIRACFALSSFLNDESIVNGSLAAAGRAGTKHADLLMFHGDRDTMVHLDWGRKTFDALRKYGINGEFVVTRNAMHELKKSQMLRLQEWIGKLLPPTSEQSLLTNKL